jgi:hypothetical protein
MLFIMLSIEQLQWHSRLCWLCWTVLATAAVREAAAVILMVCCCCVGWATCGLAGEPARSSGPAGQVPRQRSGELPGAFRYIACFES